METEIASQNLRIRLWLDTGRSLTSLDALHQFNCFRLSARIYDLRDQGMRIKAETIEIISGGKVKRITKYSKG